VTVSSGLFPAYLLTTSKISAKPRTAAFGLLSLPLQLIHPPPKPPSFSIHPHYIHPHDSCSTNMNQILAHHTDLPRFLIFPSQVPRKQFKTLWRRFVSSRLFEGSNLHEDVGVGGERVQQGGGGPLLSAHGSVSKALSSRRARICLFVVWQGLINQYHTSILYRRGCGERRRTLPTLCRRDMYSNRRGRRLSAPFRGYCQ
jgi:hypothetical protein